MKEEIVERKTLNISAIETELINVRECGKDMPKVEAYLEPCFSYQSLRHYKYARQVNVGNLKRREIRLYHGDQEACSYPGPKINQNLLEGGGFFLLDISKADEARDDAEKKRALKEASAILKRERKRKKKIVKNISFLIFMKENSHIRFIKI